MHSAPTLFWSAMHTTRISGTLVLLLAIFTLAVPHASAYAAGAVAQYSAAAELLESGNSSGAAAAFSQAVALDPVFFEAWNGLADALNREGRFSEALAASNRSLEINPEYVTGWINRGQILYNIGYQYEDTARDMKRANLLYDEQLAAFEKAISLDNSSAEAWFNKGFALGGMKRYDEAIAAFDVVYSLDPSYPNLLKNREIAVQLRDQSAPGTSVPVTGTPVTRTLVETPAPGTVATKAPLIPYLVIFGIAGAALAICRRH